MTPQPTPSIYAIDFGTSNSLLAAASAERTFAPIPLDPLASDPSVLRSILFFSEQSEWFFGEEGLNRYVADGMRGRLIRSIKRFLPLASFSDTLIGTRRVRLEELIGVFLRRMRERANDHFGADVRRVLLGRPARFSTEPEADRLAEERLRRAALLAGFEDVHFCPEPVAAAYDFRSRARSTTTLLVADLGGGTSDFTVARLAEGDAISVLSMGGLSVAGDALDGSIMRHDVAPHFGANVKYRAPFGNNVLTMPRPVIERLCSPAELCLLARRDVRDFLRDVQSSSLGENDREQIDKLLVLIDDALGFRVFESIETTKRALSSADHARFSFDYPDIEIEAEVSRASFESNIAGNVERIFECLEETLAGAGLGPADIDLVCSTGGTARVPLIARGLEARFGSARMHTLSSFHSVILGLAEKARDLCAT